MRKAFPDLDYHFAIEGMQGDVVNVSVQLSGTHKGQLDLTPLGLGVVPASGKSFKLPQEHGKARVYNGKVVSLALNGTPEAGIMGILKQIGVPTPTHA